MPMLASAGSNGVQRLPASGYVDVTTGDTGRQVWGRIHMAACAVPVSFLPVPLFGGVGLCLERVMGLWVGRVPVEVTVSRGIPVKPALLSIGELKRRKCV